MKALKSTAAMTAFGLFINLLLTFAILFDPTELAVGAQFFTLPTLGEVIAQGLGNIVWIVGALYAFVTLISIIMIFGDETMQDAMTKAKEAGNITNYRTKWYTYPMFIWAFVISLVALGSGFWFTGFFWLTGNIAVRIVSVKAQKSAEYIEATS